MESAMSKYAVSMILLVSALTLAVFAGCSETTLNNTCLKDTDCPGQLICVQGLCKDPPPCVFDYECASDEICTDAGACVDASLITGGDCTADTDCADGELCNDDGQCIDVQPADGDITDTDKTDDADPDDTVTDGDTDPVVDGDADSTEEPDTADPEPDVAEEDVVVNPDDRDNDTILNENDNCPDVPNTEQDDYDDDGRGDVCDNCPFTANNGQADRDGDHIGDACDVCPDLSSQNQDDADADGRGDICDNCPQTANPDQVNTDNDDLGDICDPTPEEASACAMVTCHPYDPRYGDHCENYGLQCLGFSFTPGQCSKECAADADCPAPWVCLDGQCGCGEVVIPNQCIPPCADSSDCPDVLPTCSDMFQDGSQCTGTCASDMDCPASYKCAPNGYCYCGDNMPVCEAHTCTNLQDCTQYGLDGCLDVFDNGQKLCTSFCDSNSPCPGAYTCLEGMCVCVDPTPETCPQGECQTKENCWSAGYPDTARCLIPAGQCSMPCDGQPADFCASYFRSNLYTCQDIGGGNGSWCTCAN